MNIVPKYKPETGNERQTVLDSIVIDRLMDNLQQQRIGNEVNAILDSLPKDNNRSGGLTQEKPDTILSRFLNGHGESTGHNLAEAIDWYNADAGGMLQGKDARGYASLLSLFQNNPTLSQALQQYLQGNNYLPWSSDALQNLIQMYASQAATNEARQYDSPLAQLNRLMAAGMSREAALKAISNQPTSPASVPAMMPSSQSAMNDASIRNMSVQNTLGTMSALMQVASTFVGLANFGISVPTQVAHAAIETVNAQEAMKVQQGEQAAGMITNAVAGMDIPEDVWQSPEKLKNFLSSSDDPVLKQTLNHPVVATAWNNNQTWDSLYRAYGRNVSNRGAKELETQATWRVKQWQAQSMLSQLQFDQAFLNYSWDTSKFGDYLNTRDIINDYNLKSWTANLALIAAETTPEMMQKRIETLQNDYTFLATTAWFKAQQVQYMQGRYNNDPQMSTALQTCWIMDACGVTDGLISNVIRASAGLPQLLDNLTDDDGALGGSLQQLWDMINETGNVGFGYMNQAAKQLAALLQKMLKLGSSSPTSGGSGGFVPPARTN